MHSKFINTNQYMFLIIYIVLNILKYCYAQCQFDYNNDFPTKHPCVLLSDYNTLLEPKQDRILLDRRQAIIVTCPGPGNVIDIFNQPFMIAYCNSGKYLSVRNRNFELNQLGCRKNVEAECRETTTLCAPSAPSAKMINISYQITNYNYALKPLYKVCYDFKNRVSLFVWFNIYGATISQSRNPPNRPNFKFNGLNISLAAQREIVNAYIQENQVIRFNDILHSNTYIEKNRKYIAKGHLNANGDQVLNTTKTATFTYVNILPMWQQVNVGNWKNLESTIRILAQRTRDQYEILAGGHEILELPDFAGRNKQIYLADNNKVAVPKYLWKIVYSVQKLSGMGFIVLNNPYYSGQSINLCQSICNNYGWGRASWTLPNGGLLICCSIDNLKLIIPQIQSLCIHNVPILRGPN